MTKLRLRLPRNRWLRALVLAGLAAVLLTTGVYLWFHVAARRALYDDLGTVPATHTAMLLGTSKRLAGGADNPFFYHRIEAVVALYKAGKVRVILVSGDNSDEYYNEPADMRAELVARGIPAEAIILDYAGLRTLDSVVRANSIFELNHFIIVSQRFHLERALFIARSKNISAVGFVARDPASIWMQIRITGRELLARIATVLDCYVFNTQPRYTTRTGADTPLND
jgi:SanA protein